MGSKMATAELPCVTAFRADYLLADHRVRTASAGHPAVFERKQDIAVIDRVSDARDERSKARLRHLRRTVRVLHAPCPQVTRALEELPFAAALTHRDISKKAVGNNF